MQIMIAFSMINHLMTVVIKKYFLTVLYAVVTDPSGLELCMDTSPQTHVYQALLVAFVLPSISFAEFGSTGTFFPACGLVPLTTV